MTRYNNKGGRDKQFHARITQADLTALREMVIELGFSGFGDWLHKVADDWRKMKRGNPQKESER